MLASRAARDCVDIGTKLVELQILKAQTYQERLKWRRLIEGTDDMTVKDFRWYVECCRDLIKIPRKKPISNLGQLHESFISYYDTEKNKILRVRAGI